MDYRDYERLIKELINKKNSATERYEKREIESELRRVCYVANKNLTAWDRVCIARNKLRPKATDYINNLFSDFIELHGDRCYGDDGAVISGIGMFHNIPVTVIAQAKGKSTEENIKRNFGMSNPEGYRKVMRIAKQAEKFNRPIITFVDTAGAYPGREAEERGQAEAIAKCLFEFSSLETIIICVVIGEGGSGGALALSVGDCVVMLENSIYSILSPEGFSSILWKDETKVKEASEMMKLTALDLMNKKVVDEIIKEPFGGAQNNFFEVLKILDDCIYKRLKKLKKLSKNTLVSNRYKKYRNIGVY